MPRLPVDQPYTVTTAFGVPDSNALFGKHSGLDYYLYEEPIGSPIYAPASGQLWNIPSKTGGNMVVIFDGTWFHRLMHNSSFSRGDGYVDEGNEVARSGYTGLVVPKDARGAHCHWDINNQGVYPDSFAAFIDPNVWLSNQGDDDMQATPEQIDNKISKAWQIGYGKPANDGVFETWRPFYKSNYIDADQEMMRQIDIDPNALKNKPQGGGKFTPVNEQLYRENK